MESYWREKARPIVARVLKETKDKSENEIRKALHNAYPFGPRQYHPYKIWLDEIAKQRGQKSRVFGKQKKDEPTPKEQMSLF